MKTRTLRFALIASIALLALAAHSNVSADEPGEVEDPAGIDELVDTADTVLKVELGEVDTQKVDCRLYTGYRYDVVAEFKGDAPASEARWIGDTLYLYEPGECPASGYERDMEALDIDDFVDSGEVADAILIIQPDRNLVLLPASAEMTVLRAIADG